MYLIWSKLSGEKYSSALFLQIFQFANGLISIKEGKSLPSVSRYNADRQEINAATHATSAADFFVVFFFLFVFRQSQ